MRQSVMLRRVLRRPASSRPDERHRVCIVRQSDIYEHVRREAEALSGAGFDVEVILMRGDRRPAR